MDHIPQIFNKKIIEFAEQIMNVFPQLRTDTLISSLYDKIQTTITLKPMMPIFA